MAVLQLSPAVTIFIAAALLLSCANGQAELITAAYSPYFDNLAVEVRQLRGWGFQGMVNNGKNRRSVSGKGAETRAGLGFA